MSVMNSSSKNSTPTFASVVRRNANSNNFAPPYASKVRFVRVDKTKPKPKPKTPAKPLVENLRVVENCLEVSCELRAGHIRSEITKNVGPIERIHWESNNKAFRSYVVQFSTKKLMQKGRKFLCNHKTILLQDPQYFEIGLVSIDTQQLKTLLMNNGIQPKTILFARAKNGRLSFGVINSAAKKAILKVIKLVKIPDYCVNSERLVNLKPLIIHGMKNPMTKKRIFAKISSLGLTCKKSNLFYTPDVIEDDIVIQYRPYAIAFVNEWITRQEIEDLSQQNFPVIYGHSLAQIAAILRSKRFFVSRYLQRMSIKNVVAPNKAKEKEIKVIDNAIKLAQTLESIEAKNAKTVNESGRHSYSHNRNHDQPTQLINHLSEAETSAEVSVSKEDEQAKPLRQSPSTHVPMFDKQSKGKVDSHMPDSPKEQKDKSVVPLPVNRHLTDTHMPDISMNKKTAKSSLRSTRPKKKKKKNSFSLSKTKLVITNKSRDEFSIAVNKFKDDKLKEKLHIYQEFKSDIGLVKDLFNDQNDLKVNLTHGNELLVLLSERKLNSKEITNKELNELIYMLVLGIEEENVDQDERERLLTELLDTQMKTNPRHGGGASG